MPRRGDAGAAVAEVPAAVAVVRATVREVPRHADWSPEVLRVRWQGRGNDRTRRDADLVGARFAGWSRTGPVVWRRDCQVVADGPRCFAWVTLPTWWNHDATLWRIDLAAAGPATTAVTLSYEVLADAPWFIQVGGVVSGRVRRLPGFLQATVDAIARDAGQSGRGSRPRSRRSSVVRSRVSS